MTVYIDFCEIHAGTKKVTREWHVLARTTRTILGEVRWYTAWRRYVFYPAITHQCLFNAGCLEEVSAFLDRQTTEQQKDAAKRRQQRSAA
jgi:endonuclease IV